MNKKLPIYNPLAILGIPISIVLAIFFLTKSSIFQANPEHLSVPIILDLLITVPLIYFLLIRKTQVPNYTVASVFVLCLIIASFILPENQQVLLSQIKMIAIPVVEMGIFIFLFVHFRKVYLHYKNKKGNSPDFFSTLQEACANAFPKGVSTLIATEIAVVYYSLFNWKKVSLQKQEFTYFKKSGIILVLYVMMSLIAIETFAIHILIEQWSPTIAWVATGLSIYTCFQLFALIRSMPYRPIQVDVANKKLHLKYGFFSETTINIKDIERIEMTARSLPEKKGIIKFSPLDMLDSHNLILHLKTSDNILLGFYGRKKTYQGIAIYVDQKNDFIELIESIINH